MEIIWEYGIKNVIGSECGKENCGHDDDFIKANSTFILSYMISENYMYTIKNENVVTTNMNDSLWEASWGRLTAFFIRVTDWLGADNMDSKRGMLALYVDNGNIGEEDSSYEAGFLGYHNVEADPKNKTLKVRVGWGNNSMTYNLDGWTGRYGMPLDFLISVQVATMMPDLAYDIATTFRNTEIKLLLHKTKGDIDPIYNSKGREITLSDLNEKTEEVKNDYILKFGGTEDNCKKAFRKRTVF